MSDHIPLEVQQEILKRLPVKLLIQLRSVSKAWKSLIDSSQFITAHSTFAHSHRLLVTYEDRNQINHVSLLDDHTFPQQKFTPILPRSVSHDSRVVGTSHGLFCTYGYYDHSFKSEIFNPSIRKSIQIAIDLPNELSNESHKNLLGFGVSPLNFDPKIVKITQSSITNSPWKVEIYSLRLAKWKSVSSIMSSETVTVTWSQTVVDRFIHWIATDFRNYPSQKLILSFDMTNENFSMVYLPHSLSHHPEDLSIFKLRESIAVIEYSMNTDEQVCGVWIMEDNLFTKVFTINIANASMKILDFRYSGEPIIELVDYNKDRYEPTALVMYEPNSEVMSDVGIYATKYSFSVRSYTETLILLGRSDCFSY